MDEQEQIEKLMVALMVLLDQQEGQVRMDMKEYQRMFDIRHQMGIQVQELGDDGFMLKLGKMTVNPDDAELN